MSQPAISQGISILEETLGEELFSRHPTGMYLTDEGRVFAERMTPATHTFSAAFAGLTNLTGSPLRLVTMAQLKALVGVTDHGSFASASRAMDLAQPTLHRACRTLEAAVGAPLFEKTSWGLRPTRQAEELSRITRLFFSELDQAVDAVRSSKGKSTGRFVIGAMPLARSGLVPRLVDKFLKQHPHFRISIIGGAYHDLVTGLRDGRIDILVGALRGNELAEDLSERFLFDDRLSIIMRPEHPLANRETLTISDLKNANWVAAFPGTPLREQFTGLFTENEVPTDVIECNALSAARVLLRESDRLMLLSDAQTDYERTVGLLISKPIPDQVLTRQIGLTTRTGWRPTEPQQAFLDLLENAHPAT